MQRFISEDPIGLAGGVNVYTYVGNNPLSWVDPLGLSSDTLSGQSQPHFPGPFDVFIPGTPANDAFVDTTIQGLDALSDTMHDAVDSIYEMAKGGKQNVKDTGLIGVPTDAIKDRLKNPSISKEEKKRLEKELKARGVRNKQKRCD